MTNPTIPHGTKEQDMSEELKPCPCCEHPATLDKWQDADPYGGDDITMGQVTCLDCGLSGPAAPLSEASAAWNRRTPPRMKALQWEQEPDLPHLWDADGMGMLYRVIERQDGTASLRIGNPNREHSAYGDIEAAFAFAHEHFTRRVHACLEGYDD